MDWLCGLLMAAEFTFMQLARLESRIFWPLIEGWCCCCDLRKRETKWRVTYFELGCTFCSCAMFGFSATELACSTSPLLFEATLLVFPEKGFIFGF